MDALYYEMIFKRKSFHRFCETGPLSGAQLARIERQFSQLRPLVPGIRTAFRLVPREKTTCKRGEWCVLIYSERKEHALLNVGYLAEQLDLYLASQNIGACWYGMGKTEEPCPPGLSFVIMIALAKVAKTDFRCDYTRAKRKPLPEIWAGTPRSSLASVVRYAPSACNTQPWWVESRADGLSVYRIQGKRGLMPEQRAWFYNTIDMGIFLLFVELCLDRERTPYRRVLAPEPAGRQAKTLTACYRFPEPK